MKESHRYLYIFIYLYIDIYDIYITWDMRYIWDIDIFIEIDIYFQRVEKLKDMSECFFHSHKLEELPKKKEKLTLHLLENNINKSQWIIWCGGQNVERYKKKVLMISVIMDMVRALLMDVWLFSSEVNKSWKGIIVQKSWYTLSNHLKMFVV